MLVARKTDGEDQSPRRINPVLMVSDRHVSTQVTMNKEQVLGAVMTVEQWSHSQRCQLIERLLPLCNSLQLDMLWTVLQPSLHRDYFYAVQSRYPNYRFRQISTPSSRTHEKRESRQGYLNRGESVYLSAINDLREFRDDGDGQSNKSTSFFKYFEEKSLAASRRPSARNPIGSPSRESKRTTYESVDLLARKKRISAQYACQPRRSVTLGWADRSVSRIDGSKIQPTIGSEKLIDWFSHAWSESVQNDFLRQLIVKFDERQQYFTSCVIVQRYYRDFISLLPRKVALQILKYLSCQELCLARQVCQSWKRILDSEPDLWKTDVNSKVSDASGSSRVDWENVQRQRVTTKRNWLSGTGQLIKCAGHTERVLCICGDQVHLATGGLDRTIRIWVLNDGTLHRVLTGHSKGVWSLKFLSSLLLVSGAYDATIKIWNINTGICLRTVLAHSGPVWSLACSNVFCLSGSQDRTARLWRLPKCELHSTLIGHTSSVFGVDLNQEQNLCATASADKTVRVWSLSTSQCVRILHTTTNDYIMSVSLRYGYLAYAFGVHIIAYALNLTESRECTATKIMETHEHRGRIESVQLILLSDGEKQPSLISAGQDGLVKFWDFNAVASQHTYNIQNDQTVKINCIYVDPTHLVTVDDDGLVKILDFSPKTPREKTSTAVPPSE